MWKKIKTELVEFYKGCVNYQNIKMLALFIIIPYALSGSLQRGIKWGIGYIIVLIIIWILIRTGVIYKNHEKSKLGD